MKLKDNRNLSGSFAHRTDMNRYYSLSTALHDIKRFLTPPLFSGFRWADLKLAGIYDYEFYTSTLRLLSLKDPSKSASCTIQLVSHLDFHYSICKDSP